MPAWKKEVTHGWYEGNAVTVRQSTDGQHALIARGHISLHEMIAGPPHAHVWGMGSDVRIHDIRLGTGARMFPNVRDDERHRQDVGGMRRQQAIDNQHERLVNSLQELARVERVDKTVLDKAKSIQSEFKAIGKASPHNYQTFQAVMDQIFESSRKQFEDRKREWANNKSAKERIVSRAESLAGSQDLRSASDQMKQLFEEWKKIGPCEKNDNERLWKQFNSARNKLNERKKQDFERRQREWANNKSAKERIVSRAESLAGSQDLRSASDQMKQLFEEWKRIGPCEKNDNERLWKQFNSARNKLNERKKQDFERRQREWANNRDTKQRLINEMNSLSSTSDFRTARETARSLTAQWKSVGPCSKEDSNRLWDEFKRAQDRFWNAAKAAGDQRREEAKQRARERVSRLEDQLRNTEMAIYRAEESYGRALNSRSPSMNNPNWQKIVQNQQERRSSAQARVVSLHQRKNQIVDRLLEARNRLNQMN